MTVGLKRYVLTGVAIVTASVLAGVTLAPAFAAPQLALALPDGVYPLECRVEGGALTGCFPPRRDSDTECNSHPNAKPNGIADANSAHTDTNSVTNCLSDSVTYPDYEPTARWVA